MEPGSGVEARPRAGFASLPRFVSLDVFARLPADARLLLALVSPSWRAVVAEPSLWACVDLSEASGVTRTSDALLLACSAKARGGLHSLDVCGRVWKAQGQPPERLRPTISTAALQTTLQNNARSFRHLQVLCPPLGGREWRFLNDFTTKAVLGNLLRAAPDLTRIDVDIIVNTFDASLLRNGVVCVRRLCLDKHPASFSAFLADARQCLSLSELSLDMRLDVPEVEAILDFALHKPLTALSIAGRVTTAAMPSLARLVSGGSLTTLEVWYPEGELVPSPAFCDAIAAAPLVRLYFMRAGLFDALAAGLSLLAAVTRHPTLRHLVFIGNRVAPAGRKAVGAALGLLVAADSPLITLDISDCALGSKGLLPLIDALPHNTHLRRLSCTENEFTRLTAARLLAAVRANTSLVDLEAAYDPFKGGPCPDLVEAEAVVEARTM